MPNLFEYQFEWDPIKAHQNARKHGVTFERAATVFLDPQALSGFDEEHSQEEDRWITLGLGPHRDLVDRLPHLSGRNTDKREDSDYVGP